MKQANSPVRVIEIIGTEEPYYKEVYITKFKEFKSRTVYTMYGKTVKLYPYKWYDIRWLYEIPAFYAVNYFLKNSLLNARNPTHIATKIAIVLIETTIAYFFTNYALQPIGDYLKQF